MTHLANRAKIVRVRVEEGETGLFYATSPELSGLLVAEPSMEALEKAIPQAITEMYAAVGETVVVLRVDEGEEHEGALPWVTFPAEIARQALGLA